MKSQVGPVVKKCENCKYWELDLTEMQCSQCFQQSKWEPAEEIQA